MKLGSGFRATCGVTLSWAAKLTGGRAHLQCTYAFWAARSGLFFIYPFMRDIG
jgi:hypothetical protein